MLLNVLYFLTTTIRIAILLLGILKKMSNEFNPPNEGNTPKPYAPDPRKYKGAEAH